METNRREVEKLLSNENTFLWYQALHITGKAEDAEDLLQDTMMKVCKGIDSFRSDTNFRAWAKKIMINTYINKVRQGTPDLVPLDDTTATYENNSFGDLQRVPYSNNPEKVFFQNHINEKLMELFYSLPEKHRTVFSLFHFEGYSYEEISKAVKMPVGTVKSRIHRTRQYLSEKIPGMRILEQTAN